MVKYICGIQAVIKLHELLTIANNGSRLLAKCESATCDMYAYENRCVIRPKRGMDWYILDENSYHIISSAAKKAIISDWELKETGCNYNSIW